MIASIWIEWARWSAKKTTMARLTKISKSAPETASRGKSSVRVPQHADGVQAGGGYTSVATNVLSTIWLGRSRRKLRSSRGEN